MTLNQRNKKPAKKSFFQSGSRKRHILEGYIFISPFIIGTAAFFLYPMVFSIVISLGTYSIKKGGATFDFLGFRNYIDAITQDVSFTSVFFQVVRDSLINTPMVVVFSLLLAILLNKKIKAKGFFRTVFFLPFLLGTGYVMRQLLGMGVGEQAMNMARGAILPVEVQYYIGPALTQIAMEFLNRITFVLWKCGVPIILFLSGLQSINQALYESARVEGATEWEVLWKITIPMTSPVTLLVMVYSVIDSFTDPNNPMVDLFYTVTFTQLKYSYSAAMSWIYFVFITIFVGIIFLVMKRFVYSESSVK